MTEQTQKKETPAKSCGVSAERIYNLRVNSKGLSLIGRALMNKLKDSELEPARSLNHSILRLALSDAKNVHLQFEEFEKYVAETIKNMEKNNDVQDS